MRKKPSEEDLFTAAVALGEALHAIALDNPQAIRDLPERVVLNAQVAEGTLARAGYVWGGRGGTLFGYAGAR